MRQLCKLTLAAIAALSTGNGAAFAITYAALKEASPYAFHYRLERISVAAGIDDASGGGTQCVLKGFITRVFKQENEPELAVGAPVAGLHACRLRANGEVDLVLVAPVRIAPQRPPVQRADGTVDDVPGLAAGDTIECFGVRVAGTTDAYRCMN